AFTDKASNLVPGDTNGLRDVFLRDLTTNQTELVSLAYDGSLGNADSFIAPSAGAISSDGRYVAFNSDATNLIPGHTNARVDAFIRDRLLGTTTVVDVSSGGVLGNSGGGVSSMSHDGRFVAFTSTSTNLVPGPTGDLTHVFVRDRLLEMTEIVDVASDGTLANGSPRETSISADGRFIVFQSSADNLVPGDTNGFMDVFVRDRFLGLTER